MLIIHSSVFKLSFEPQVDIDWVSHSATCSLARTMRPHSANETFGKISFIISIKHIYSNKQRKQGALVEWLSRIPAIKHLGCSFGSVGSNPAGVVLYIFLFVFLSFCSSGTCSLIFLANI
jgi:hypothetical protein